MQFVHYVGDLARGNLGNSLTTGQPVVTDLIERLPASMELTLFALVFAVVLAIPMGVWAATKPDSLADHICRASVSVAAAFPTFFAGLLLVYIFYFLLDIAPEPVGRLNEILYTVPPRITGAYTVDALIAGDWQVFGAALAQLVLPSISLGLFAAGLRVDDGGGLRAAQSDRRSAGDRDRPARAVRSLMRTATLARNIGHAFGENRLTLAAVLVLVLLLLCAAFGQSLVPYNPLMTDGTAKLSPPTLAHLFGTDALGRDILSRVVTAARLDLGMAISAVVLSFIGGLALGAAAGYFGGWTDRIIGRVMDTIMAFPLFVLAMGIVAALGNSVRNPWNTALTSGGSSAGSAASVAAGVSPFAIGSDGGGSVRIPASLCGLYGIKASMGRVPLYPGCRDERYPGISSWESLEHIGPISRTVATVPAGFTADGRPVGLQITGRHLADATVLRASAAFERARPWAQHWPTLVTQLGL